MKKITLILSSLLFLISQKGMAFEAGQLTLDTPNVLKKNEGSFGIRHRFFGKADDYEKFLGSDDGGNMHFLLKYAVMDNLALSVDHTRSQSAYGVGIEYAKSLEKYGTAGLRLNGYTLDDFNFEDRKQSYFINGSYQSPNFFDHLRLTTNLGYDGYYENTILGFGADMNLKNPIKWLTFTENLSFLAEYYPTIEDIDGVTGKYDSYAFGFKNQTFGHHFEVLLSNSTNMDPRTMALGSNSKDLHLGFNINRKF
jgi:hypothetical protein